MARGQIWQNFPKLLRFMAPFHSLGETSYKVCRRITRKTAITQASKRKAIETHDNTQLNNKRMVLLGQGCLSVLFREQYPPPLLKWVKIWFCQCPEMVDFGVEKWVFRPAFGPISGHLSGVIRANRKFE